MGEEAGARICEVWVAWESRAGWYRHGRRYRTGEECYAGHGKYVKAIGDMKVLRS